MERMFAPLRNRLRLSSTARRTRESRNFTSTFSPWEPS
jgi:hypothetical protein